MTADFERQHQLAQRISSNANRFNKNPYFLHSICTPNEKPHSTSGTNNRAQSAKPNHRRMRKASRSRGTVSQHNLSALPPVVNM